MPAALNAALAHYTQHTRLIRLHTPLGSDLLPECVRGVEAIDSGFCFDIDALAHDADIALKSLIGQPALLELLTAESNTALRPFHGHITGVDIVGANGGFARYRLRLQPWTSFLAHGRDSRIFQDMTVFDILDAVFASYATRGRLAPAWRFALADRRIYPRRSLTTQYQESDLAFVQRLMREDGLFAFFEHHGAASSKALGSHTLVVADHNGAFVPNTQADIAFTQPGAVMQADSLDRWRSTARLLTNAVTLESWDYSTLRQRQVSVASADSTTPEMRWRDTPGVYAWPSRADGERSALRQLQALEVAQQLHYGAGTVRTCAPGTTFALHGHASVDGVAEDARRFTILRAEHLMHNNLSAEVLGEVAALLGPGALADEAERDAAWRTARPEIGARPLYRNRIDVIPASLPYRSSSQLQLRPSVHGQQTAIVVGPAGAVVHTDRAHRIKIQFHWQRGDASHSRASHPYPAGHSGAPGNDTAGTWVRIATPLAGANWGSNFVPRVGQEVLVDFIDGNIDRPVVIACLYNGRGQINAQHNQMKYGAGPAVGSAPPWFPGTSAGHAHAAVLSGFKSQSLQASAQGSGAYNQLVFDDSAGQPRIALQRHGQPHDGDAELNLGHLQHQSDNARLHAVGSGAELKTAQSLALRAGRGLLLTTEEAPGASGQQLDARAALRQIQDSGELQQSLATQAQSHNAKLKNEALPADLAAIAQMRHSAEVIATLDGDQVKVPAFSEPQLQLASPAGIVIATPRDAIMSAHLTASLSAAQDINLVAQGNSCTTVAKGISLFTYGKATNASKPQQETGLKLHAASGKFSSQSQSGPTALLADKTVTVASVTSSVAISAPNKHVLLTAQGAYIKLEGGNIEVHAPGKVAFKASMKELAGPVSVPGIELAMKLGELNLKRDLEIEYVDADGNALSDEAIELSVNDQIKASHLDADGKTTIKNMPLGPFRSKQPRRV